MSVHAAVAAAALAVLLGQLHALHGRLARYHGPTKGGWGSHADLLLQEGDPAGGMSQKCRYGVCCLARR